MKKILFVTPYFYPDVGGLENYVYNIAKSLKKDFSWEVVVITSGKNKKIVDEFIDGIRVYRLPVMFKISNTPINPKWYFNIKKIIKREKPDIINAHSPVPFISDIAGLLAGNIPFVLTYHAGTMKKNKFFFDLIINLYEVIILKNTVRRATKVICVSNFIKKSIMKNYKYKTHIINPGVDISLFNNINREKVTNRTVIFVGKSAVMYKMKGLYYLIDAISKLSGVKLKIIGEKINLKNRNIEFLGILRGQDLVNEIRNSAVLVLPSLPNVESFGTVLLEAMACRVPVIGTNIGGISEVIIDKEDGILVKAKSADSISEAIRKIISDPDFAEKIALGGYKKVRRDFTWDKKTSETNILFNHVISTN